MTYPPPGDYGPPPDQVYPPTTQAPYHQPSPVYLEGSYQPVEGYQPPSAYPDPYNLGHGSPYGYPPYPLSAPNDGLAIASLVVSCVAAAGLCAYGLGGLLGIVGAVLGHAGRRRIRDTGAGGDGMALAGIVVGWIATGIAILAIVGFIVMIAVISPTEGTS